MPHFKDNEDIYIYIFIYLDLYNYRSIYIRSNYREPEVHSLKIFLIIDDNLHPDNKNFCCFRYKKDMRISQKVTNNLFQSDTVIIPHTLTFGLN